MRFWCRWLQPTQDYRPLTDPPNEAILGWWCSGIRIGGETETPILCALVEAKDEATAITAIHIEWPEAKWDGTSFTNPVADDFRPGNRFPAEGWSKQRIERKAP